MNESESLTITDKILQKLQGILNSMGGLVNPWLWGAVLMIILIGQSWAVKIFVGLALGISIYFKWFHKSNPKTKVKSNETRS